MSSQPFQSSRFFRPPRLDALDGTELEGSDQAEVEPIPPPLPTTLPAAADPLMNQPISEPSELIGSSEEWLNDIQHVAPDAIRRKASDILSSCENLFYRVDGRLIPQGAAPYFVDSILQIRPDLRRNLENIGGTGAEDFAIEIEGRRFRVNIFRAQGKLNAALRPIPNVAPPADVLGLEQRLLDRVLQAKQGLILVTGPTGSGKSTTVNCLVDWINQHRACHILTAEDPIEFVYTPKLSAIEQREVGVDVNGFDEAIRAAMRENPDVIVVGEIRDYATLKAGLQAAETGHLVFGTMHTRRAAATVSRAITLAPGSEREDTRGALVNSLLMILCQLLLPRATGGRVACREIMISNAAILNLIREKNEAGIPSELILNRKTLGTMEYNQALKILLDDGVITQATYDDYKDTQKSIAHA